MLSHGLVDGCSKLFPIIAKLKILMLVIIIAHNLLPPKQELCNFYDLFSFLFVTN